MGAMEIAVNLGKTVESQVRLIARKQKPVSGPEHDAANKLLLYSVARF